MTTVYRTLIVGTLLIAAAAATQGCQTLREIAALRSVDFALDQVANARLAGVDIQRIQSYEDLRTTDVLRIGAAIAEGRLPLRFDLQVAARNPAENQVQARMVRMDWTLLLEDRETISGVMNERFVIPPGETRTFPIGIELDLVDFFDEGTRDLVEIALAVAGQGEPRNVKLRALPTIDTPIGEIEYPSPITIVSRDIGASAGTGQP